MAGREREEGREPVQNLAGVRMAPRLEESNQLSKEVLQTRVFILGESHAREIKTRKILPKVL